ncbi:MAG: O-antigen ligase family protein [Thermoanaerobaculia bacterium]
MSRGSRKKEAAPARRRDAGTFLAAAALAAALASSALLVDPAAEAAFEAPKRLAALCLIALATAGAFLMAPRGGSLEGLWRRAGRLPRAALVLFAVALAGVLAAAFFSPRRSASLDALRPLLLFALLVPLGASRALARHGRALLALFLGLAAVNAALSTLQWRGLLRPFALEVTGLRDATGAFVGNVGYLALALALAVVAALAVALETRNATVRVVCAAAILLYLADLVVNQNLTSLTALAFGGAALAATRFGGRAVLPIAAIVAAVLLGIWAFRPARARASEAIAAARAGDWDRLFTYRMGPWSAAIEMARERPLTGFGPGTFAAEFVPHRLKAELSARRRFVNPLVTSSYGEAHSEPLQAVAEGGLAGLAAVAAFAALLPALWRVARAGGAASAEAALLLAVLVAGAVASLTWFPLQRPVSSIPLLLAAGRGWRLSAEAGSPEET